MKPENDFEESAHLKHLVQKMHNARFRKKRADKRWERSVAKLWLAMDDRLFKLTPRRLSAIYKHAISPTLIENLRKEVRRDINA